VTRFAFVDREKALYAVAVLCRLLKVSRAGYYAWSLRPPSAREVADAVLTTQIQDAFDSNRKVYGSPRIHAELADADVNVGRKRVARLMRLALPGLRHRRVLPDGPGLVDGLTPQDRPGHRRGHHGRAPSRRESPRGDPPQRPRR